jgi:DNA-binding response OmpR family regulator
VNRSMDRRLALVVDDSPELRLQMAAICRREGLDVIEAGDGESALAAARARRPDIVCLDLMLPTMSGFMVCERIKQQPETADVPVLVASARSYPQDRAEAELAGADAYVMKPINVEEFAAALRSLLWQGRKELSA